MLSWAPRFLFCYLGAALLALVGGCGVHEYEKKMLDSQIRLQSWEEFSRLLGGPIGVPTRVVEEEQRPIANMFLRLPKNLYSQQEEKPRANILFVYTAASPGPVDRVELAAGDQKDFEAEVMRNFASDGQVKTRETVVRAVGRETPTKFVTTELRDEKFLYSINIWTGSTKVAIIYCILKNQEASAKKYMDASLQSFAGDREAGVQRDLFLKGSPIERVPAESR
jgi:hypothetical protein